MLDFALSVRAQVLPLFLVDKVGLPEAVECARECIALLCGERAGSEGPRTRAEDPTRGRKWKGRAGPRVL